MFKAFNQFFMMISLFFSAGQKVGMALDSIAGIGQEMAEGFALEERLKRKQRIAVLQKDLDKGLLTLEAEAEAKA
jgi:ribosomal protein S13